VGQVRIFVELDPPATLGSRPRSEGTIAERGTGLLTAIAESIPMAMGVALSPLPVAAVRIVLSTPRARSNGPAFVAGWIVGITAIGGVVVLAPGLGKPTRLAGVVQLALGAAPVALSVRQWRNRPPPGRPVELPATLTRLDDMGVRQASWSDSSCPR